MISLDYKMIYDVFIKHYKEKHVNPWHEINENELNNIFDSIVNTQNIDDDYSFNYLMNYVIKKLSGNLDAHTIYYDVQRIPMNFKIFDNDVFVNYPDNLKGAKLIDINGISLKDIINEIEYVITYGTPGKRKYEIEEALFNKKKLFGLPILRNENILSMKLLTQDGKEIVKKFNKVENYTNNEMFDYDTYFFGNPGTYNIIDSNLIIIHSSIQNKYKEAIENMVNDLESIDLSIIKNIIVDIRGNSGGNSKLNVSLMEFLKKSRKRIICLTDYRVFSGGRYALLDLMRLGAITIGSDIATPLNCYGNSDWIIFDKYRFSSSRSFLAPNFGIGASTKEEYKEIITEKLQKPVFFQPDLYIEQSKEDYLNGIDTILEYAINNL